MKLLVQETVVSEEVPNKVLANNQAVLLKDGIKHWPAISKWNVDYFEKICPDIEVVIKYFENKEVRFQKSSMAEYAVQFRAYKNSEIGSKSIPYCHDIPIFLKSEALLNDIEQFPGELLPEFYREKWWYFVQFFASPAGAITPLHFDTLRTNNLFFQIKGTKRFTLIPWQQKKHCLRKGWRWFDYDPTLSENGNDNQHIEATSVEVSSGDILIMPAGMLHHVQSLDDCISFNIDYHNKVSVLKSFLYIFDNIPAENLRYNWLCLKGLFFGMSHDKFYPRYQSYLNYIS